MRYNFFDIENVMIISKRINIFRVYIGRHFTVKQKRDDPFKTGASCFVGSNSVFICLVSKTNYSLA